MENRPNLVKKPLANKIYVALIGSAPMPGLDALMLSLDRFKNILSSESAQTQFETTVRTIQSSLAEVNNFIDAVYAVKDPRMAVTMTGRTLIVEINLNKNEFIEYINSNQVQKILAQVRAVGSMPAKKLPQQTMRDYISFPVKFAQGKFVKSG